MSEMLGDLPEVPEGWELQQGAGGWRCVNRTRKWATNVYPREDGAIEAAVKLQTRAERALRDQQRLCAELRAYFTEEAL